MELFEMSDGRKLMVHDGATCAAEACVIHKPMAGHMASWALHYRQDRNLFERICPEHGVGHPDPAQCAYWDSIGESYMMVHGCCGCCHDHDSVQATHERTTP
jgi:hypothetical protein